MQTQYDAVIFGAGINGVAVSKALAEVKKSVLVIEKSHIGTRPSSLFLRLILILDRSHYL